MPDSGQALYVLAWASLFCAAGVLLLALAARRFTRRALLRAGVRRGEVPAVLLAWLAAGPPRARLRLILRRRRQQAVLPAGQGGSCD
jgi:hypothetical protein